MLNLGIYLNEKTILDVLKQKCSPKNFERAFLSLYLRVNTFTQNNDLFPFYFQIVFEVCLPKINTLVNTIMITTIARK